MSKKEIQKNDLSDMEKCDKRTMALLLIVIAFSTLFTVVVVSVSPETEFNIANAPTLSYFTVQTNIITSLWLICLALYMLTGNKIYRFSMNIHLSAAITSYMVINGIIFWFVLVPIFTMESGLHLFTSQNVWMHTVTPIIAAIMLRYVNSQNYNENLKPKLIPFIIYPFIYVIMVIIFAYKGTYIYPMANPGLLGGWPGVYVSMGATCLFAGALYLVIIHLLRNSSFYN